MKKNGITIWTITYGNYFSKHENFWLLSQKTNLYFCVIQPKWKLIFIISFCHQYGEYAKILVLKKFLRIQHKAIFGFLNIFGKNYTPKKLSNAPNSIQVLHIFFKCNHEIRVFYGKTIYKNVYISTILNLKLFECSWEENNNFPIWPDIILFWKLNKFYFNHLYGQLNKNSL